jgi:hypothetical protein
MVGGGSWKHGFMLVLPAHTALPHKFLDIQAHALPIEICLSTLDNFVISRVPCHWLGVNKVSNCCWNDESLMIEMRSLRRINPCSKEYSLGTAPPP